MRKKHNIIEIDVLHKNEIELAIMIAVGLDEKNELWLPKSMVQVNFYKPETGMVNISLPEWLAVQNGLV